MHGQQNMKVGTEFAILRCVISQKRAYLLYVAAETWTRLTLSLLRADTFFLAGWFLVEKGDQSQKLSENMNHFLLSVLVITAYITWYLYGWLSIVHNVTHIPTTWPIAVAALSRAWVNGRSPAGIADSNPAGGNDVSLVWLLFCCQAKLSATGRWLFQRRPTDCDVSECVRGIYRGSQGPLVLLANEKKSKESYKMIQLCLERCVLGCDSW